MKTESASCPITMPMNRDGMLDPPPELTELRGETPVRRMSFPDGTSGWLATSHSAVRKVLADPRFSARQELFHLSPPDHPLAHERRPPANPGFFMTMDAPEHTRYRKMLTGLFTKPRAAELAPRIEQIVTEHLDTVEEQGSPADLVAAYAHPVPTLVICELLGIPYSDREQFQRDVDATLNMDLPAEEMTAAAIRNQEYLADLVRRKRVAPTDDLLGRLMVEQRLTDEELISIAELMLVAGHMTTASMLSLGIFALLCDRDQFVALRDGTVQAERAVDELLRYVSVIQFGLQRTALEDIELEGELIRAGEPVEVSMPGANRDPARFPEPDALDLDRSAVGHLGFGYGPHQCLGAHLARVELRIGYTALLRRFPDLRLAVPREEVPFRHSMPIYGVARLPVAW